MNEICGGQRHRSMVPLPCWYTALSSSSRRTRAREGGKLSQGHGKHPDRQTISSPSSHIFYKVNISSRQTSTSGSCITRRSRILCFHGLPVPERSSAILPVHASHIMIEHSPSCVRIGYKLYIKRRYCSGVCDR